MANDHEIKDELDDAKDDLRDTLQEINTRVQKGAARLRPDRGIRKHPVTSACVAGALGFALGSNSDAAAIAGILLLGGAVLLTRVEEQQSSGIEPA